MRIAGRMKAEGSWGPEEDSLARVAQAERGALCRLCSSVPRERLSSCCRRGSAGWLDKCHI